MPPNLFTTLAIGFLLGMEHALDADHVVAVSTMVSQHRTLRRSSLVGIVWGLGHTTTLFLVGLVVILLKVTIPERLALSMEFAVGMVLVILGGSVVKGYVTGKIHAHGHRHGDVVHVHFHSHAGGESHDHAHPMPQHSRTLLVGMFHGLAGSAALMLLVLASIRTPPLGLLYILVFGVGSIVGMLAISTVVGLPFILTVKKSVRIHRAIRIATGAGSIAYGIWIMAHVGIGEGLFRF